MLKFVILLGTFACALGAAIPEGLETYIVGGNNTSIDSFPWQVSLQRGVEHFCGGAIYNERIIVTAAHCLEGVSPSSLSVRAGSTYWNSGGVLVNVAAFKNHEGYNSRTLVNDIAVIRLSGPLNFGSTIRSIGLAGSAPGNDSAAQVSGWGTTAPGTTEMSPKLMYIDTKIVSLEECSSDKYGYGNRVSGPMICAASASKDSCTGDYGGPLVSGGNLVGVASWGNGCADPSYPGVYADVAALRSWVEHNAKIV